MSQPCCRSNRDAVYEGTGMADYPQDWTTKVAFMRSVGAVRAAWHDDTLASVELGPAPQAGDMTTQQSLTADEQEKRERERVARLRFAHSGGPVRPLGARE